MQRRKLAIECLTFSKWINTAELIRQDMKVAKIKLTDSEGNAICFHSLRNSYMSFLANSQTPAKVVQKLARHRDPRLTFNTYARTFEKTEQKAMNFLPSFGDFVLSTCLDSKRKKQEISRDIKTAKTL
jgi:integrase